MADGGFKSLAVLSPAGSGKTERLARRYIELLQAMPDPKRPERIVTITFTKKAAAEMKDRIFRILKNEDPKLYDLLRSRVLKLRITTIDSFCLSLLKRFALVLGLEPDLDVLATPLDLWVNSQYDTLMSIAESGPGSLDFGKLLELITERRMRGWTDLTDGFKAFYGQRAAVERARAVEFDFSPISRTAQELRDNPVGPGQIAEYRRLFPDNFDLATVLSLRPVLSRNRNAFLRADGSCRSQRKKPDLDAWYQRMFEYLQQIETVYHQDRFQRMFGLFRARFLREFDRRKRELGQVDFTDLELESYRLLTTSEHWSNILLAFDEHTDHLLVDEFQDTNFLQWGIISKLTEEWRAGQGRKAELGVEPTIFLVGDDKQSIYLFRGANVGVFARAVDALKDGLGERFEYRRSEENYRSLAAIIEFTNHVFSRLMNPADSAPAWHTRYSPFRKCRKDEDTGRVELILGLSGGKMPERRAREADLLARRINALIGRHTVYEDGKPVPCNYRHVTILLRKRTHLADFETALRHHRVPYLVQRGSGFFQEREIQLLMNLLAVLVDPYDDFNLYALLRSPLFRVSEQDLFFVSGCAGTRRAVPKAHTFFQKLGAYADSSVHRGDTESAEEGSESSRRALRLGEGCSSGSSQDLTGTIQRLAEWVAMTGRRPLTETIEDVLVRQQGWQALWEPQRHANVRKFLRMVENLEAGGLSAMRVKESLDRAATEPEGEESKASIDVRGQNVVQIMTIHAAKGLQFPVVFCPELDVDLDFAADELLVQERSAEEVGIAWLPDSTLRKQDGRFIEYTEKLREEAKRLFYVAVTRARDLLVLSGIAEKEAPAPESWLGWLSSALELRPSPTGLSSHETADARQYTPMPDSDPRSSASIGGSFSTPVPGTVLLNLDQADLLVAHATPAGIAPPAAPEPEVKVQPVHEEPRLRVVPVTRHTASEHRRHGDAAIAFGTVLHIILEQIARGLLKPDDLPAVERTAERLFLLEGAKPASTRVLEQLDRMQAGDLLGIALPQPDSYAELPFMLRKGNLILSGRIDRVVVRADTVEVYDYKTFPVKERELEKLSAEYRESQMNVYQEAARALFPGKRVRCYLLFTALPRLITV